MPRCDYLKRDATVCEAPTLKDARLCSKHKNAVPYKLCEGNCGHLVRMNHGRTKCVKCDPLNAKADSRANLKLKAREQAIAALTGALAIPPQCSLPLESREFWLTQLPPNPIIISTAEAHRDLVKALDAYFADVVCDYLEACDNYSTGLNR